MKKTVLVVIAAGVALGVVSAPTAGADDSDFCGQFTTYRATYTGQEDFDRLAGSVAANYGWSRQKATDAIVAKTMGLCSVAAVQNVTEWAGVPMPTMEDLGYVEER